jgi:DUF1365 family protein
VRSRLYSGVVRHQRRQPVRYDFRYRVYYLGVDLDELPELDRRLRLLSVERRNLYELRGGDHFGGPGRLDRAMRERLAARGLPAADWRIELVTYPRIGGYVFNPVAFYLCRDRATDAIRHVLAEVHNTHGERHVYHLDRESADTAVYRAQADKRFYVSPFIGMDARYDFRLAEVGAAEASRLSLAINASTAAGEQFLHTGLRLDAQPLTDGSLARAFAATPFLTLKTIGLIHWHAAKLWLHGVRYRRHTPQRTAP